MANLILTTALLASTFVSLTTAQTSGAACSADSQCPESTPCCSQYGQCGVGAYCLGGCDPASSFSLDSCVPQPVCKSATYTFDNLDSVVANTKYLGDASKADWVSSGQPVNYNGQMWLTMAEDTVGTLVSSTHYMWYGNAKARFATSAGAGVVTAFIILGNAKDEIDFEFVGVELGTAQTNFYNQGITNYENGENVTVSSDTHANMHDYEVDWTPDTITWSIDGNSVRTLNREDTWNETSNRYAYPQTPGQIQLSLWPAGLASNGQGTINWAGGLVQWDSQYMVNGYYYAAFDSVQITCYDPPSGAASNGSKSYVYTDDLMTNSSIETTNLNTVLSSFLATGLNETAGSQTQSAGSSATSSVNTIPGLTGAGPGTNSHDNGTSGAAASSGSGSGSGGNTGSYTATGSGSAATGFVQGSGDGNAASHVGGETAVQGSLFAVVVGIIALCVL